MPVNRSSRRRRSPPTKTAISAHFVRSLFAVLCFGLAVGFIFVVHPQIIGNIEEVECHLPNDSLCPQEVVAELQHLKGQRLLFSALKTKLDHILQPVGYTTESYARVMPHTLRVVPRLMQLSFYLTASGQTLAVTTIGEVIPAPTKIDPSLLHLLIQDEQVSVLLSSTRTIPPWLQQTVRSLEHFFTVMNVHPTRIIVQSPFEVELQLDQVPHRIIINPQESTLNLARLSSILKSNPDFDRASPSATIDVRFRLPVLRS